MTGPATPGQEGPSYAPPPLPEGWIAQWDGMSRKYYFVQLSTGASQWDTPTHPAPTGPTPQATPQGGLEHPYGTPSGDAPADGDRSLTGDIGNFAMHQMLSGGKKPSAGNSNPLIGLATSFLGGGGHGSSGSKPSSGPAAGIVGALATQFMAAGKKTESTPAPTNYSGSQTTGQGQSHGGFMQSMAGMFGGGHAQQQSQEHGSNYGYSQHNTPSGGYSGTAPPTSYQPTGAGQYNPPAQHTTQQPSYQANPSQSQTYDSHNPSYGGSHPQSPTHPQQAPYGGGAQAPYVGSPQQPAYGAQPPYSPPYGGSPQQPAYGGSPQQPAYGGGSQQPAYGGNPQQPAYGSQDPYASQPPQPQQQYGGPPSYSQPGPPQPYGAPAPSGNLPQHGHGLFHNAEHSGGLYGNGGSQPQHPQQGPPGGYQPGRW